MAYCETLLIKQISKQFLLQRGSEKNQLDELFNLTNDQTKVTESETHKLIQLRTGYCQDSY